MVGWSSSFKIIFHRFMGIIFPQIMHVQNCLQSSHQNESLIGYKSHTSFTWTSCKFCSPVFLQRMSLWRSLWTASFFSTHKCLILLLACLKDPFSTFNVQYIYKFVSQYWLLGVKFAGCGTWCILIFRLKFSWILL